MKIFLAGADNESLQAIGMKANVLQTFASINYKKPFDMRMFKDFILDSGAFTFAFSVGTKGKMDWDKYCSNYAQFVKANKIKNWMELDIDKLVGYDKVKKIRKYLEEQTGSQCIPVWHTNRGLDDFKRMCDEYKFVAIGGIRQEIGRKRYSLLQHFIDEAHKRGAKVHGLGFTRVREIVANQCMFDTVDSTTWLNGVKFFTLQKFDGKKLVTVKVPKGKTLVASTVQRRNFMLREWIKFANHIEEETEHYAK